MIVAIQEYIKHEVSNDESACVKVYEEVCENPEDWVKEFLDEEIHDVREGWIGPLIWQYGWRNIQWEEIAGYMAVEYAQYLAQCKIDKEQETIRGE